MAARAVSRRPTATRPALTELRQHGEAIDRLKRLLGDFKDWHEHSSNPDALTEISALGKRARDAVGRLADDAPTFLETRGKLKILLLDGNDLLAPEAAVGRAARDFLNANVRLREACDAFEAVAGRSVREHFAASLGELDVIRETAETIAARHRELKDWCAWWRRRTDAMDLELAPLVEAIEEDRVFH